MSTYRLPKYRNNPLIAVLPPEDISEEALFELLGNPIDQPSDDLRAQSPRVRAFACEDLKRLQVPLERDFDVEMDIACAIREGYVDRFPNADYWKTRGQEVAAIMADIKSETSQITHSRTISLTGMSGAGKSRIVETILRMYRQTHKHDIKNHPLLPLIQVVWLKLDFPSNRSSRALCISFFEEVGKLVGENYVDQYGHGNVDEMLASMAKIARDHCLGILVIDEIQHATGAQKQGSLR